MVTVNIAVAIDLDAISPNDLTVIEKSLALKIAKGNFFDSNFNLPIARVGSYLIESGFIRRSV